MVLEWLLSLDQRRRRLLQSAPAGPVADYLRVPFPPRNQPCADVEFLALDLETTGLDPARDEILSIGFVPARNLRVVFADCAHYLVKPRQAIPHASAVVHRIFDDQAATGMELQEVIPKVLEALAGKVMIAHHAPMEVGFLTEACLRLYGCKPLFPVVDTLASERRALRRREQVAGTGMLRLGALRERYGLPRYPSHNALSDAIAAAELFLAQVAHRGHGQHMHLKDFLE